jgi:hypothetical protein
VTNSIHPVGGMYASGEWKRECTRWKIFRGLYTPRLLSAFLSLVAAKPSAPAPFKMALIDGTSLPFRPKHMLMTADTMEQSDNSLVSAKPSDSGTTVSLHPLVLLTATDQITRHRVRGETQPVVGILLGQQKGREITAEHAFAAALEKDGTGEYVFKQPWLEDRTQQCKYHSRQAPHLANA